MMSKKIFELNTQSPMDQSTAFFLALPLRLTLSLLY